MRLHVISLPHTQTTSDYTSCAYTQKVVKFCRMMRSRGHWVVLYAGEENAAPCDRHVVCLQEADRREMVGKRHYTSVHWGGPFWDKFNINAIQSMRSALQPRDIICVIGGHGHKPIADAFPLHLCVEFGIGYSGTFAKYRVWESYAWMHTCYGQQQSAANADGHYFDAVIPNAVDPELFPFGRGHREGLLYVGRVNIRKGMLAVEDIAEAAGMPLTICGPTGDYTPRYGTYIGERDAAGVSALMRKAEALLMPTQYLEPFGGVAVEAMMSGCPVISTDWGAFTETIQQGVTGFRCRNLAEFTQAVSLVGGLDRAAIREYAISRYSLEVVGAQYERYFERLLTLFGKGWYADGESIQLRGEGAGVFPVAAARQGTPQ